TGSMFAPIIMQYSSTVQRRRADETAGRLVQQLDIQGEAAMRLTVLAILAGIALAAMTAPAAAQWRPYISHPLGFAFAAPGPMKVEKGTYEAPIAGRRQTTTYAFTDDNIEYKVVVIDMRD